MSRTSTFEAPRSLKQATIASCSALLSSRLRGLSTSCSTDSSSWFRHRKGRRCPLTNMRTISSYNNLLRAGCFAAWIMENEQYEPYLEPLVNWILRRIARGPASAVEILKEREQKPEGVSTNESSPILPLMRRLVDQGYAEFAVRAIQGERTRLKVTKKGLRLLEEMNESSRAPKGPSLFRRVPSYPEPPLPPREFSIRSPKRQFDTTIDILESKTLSPREREHILKEYASSLEGRLNWTNELLRERGSGPAASRRRIR